MKRFKLPGKLGASLLLINFLLKTQCAKCRFVFRSKPDTPISIKLEEAKAGIRQAEAELLELGGKVGSLLLVPKSMRKWCWL